MSLKTILSSATQRLQKAGLENASREAIFLLQAALDVDGAQLLADRALSIDEEKKIEDWLRRREKREPLARISGTRGFWKGEFLLNEATLEPRPDSETLIELALELFNLPLPPGGVRGGNLENTGNDTVRREAVPPPAPPGGRGDFRILDVGTGTGCLLLSLLQEFPKAQGVGTDKSEKALLAACENARALELEKRAQFICTNWVEGLKDRFDLVISNPPYIPLKAISVLDPEVKNFDPHLALAGGEDGLEAYRVLAKTLPPLMNKNATAIFEIRQGQEKDVTDIFIQTGWAPVAPRRDLGGILRALSFRNA